MRYLLCLLMLLPSLAYADHEDTVHLAAHVGLSYTLQTVFYGFNSKVLHLAPLQAEGLALLETLSIGLTYKLMEGASDTDINTAMGRNTLGAALAIGTHIVFKF